MKEFYVEPKIEVVALDVEDVITTSGESVAAFSLDQLQFVDISE